MQDTPTPRYRDDPELLYEVEVLIESLASLLSLAVLDGTFDSDLALHVIALFEKAGRYLAAAR